MKVEVRSVVYSNTARSCGDTRHAERNIMIHNISKTALRLRPALPVPDVNHRALAGVRQRDVLLAKAALPQLEGRAKHLGFSAGDVHACLAHVRRAPLIVNFGPGQALPLARAGRYLNLFEVSNGWQRRVTHEKRLFEYPDDLPPANRPRYGSLNALASPVGAWQYGDAMLVLADHVRHNVTLTPWDSFETHASQLGSLLGPLAHVVNQLEEGRLHSALLEATQRCNHRLCESGTSYIEAQIHQPISLEHDVTGLLLPRQSALKNDPRPYDVLDMLPVSWSGAVHLPFLTDRRELSIFEKERWNVACWASISFGHGFVFHPPSAAQKNPFTYRFCRVDTAGRDALSESLGKHGEQIVGYGIKGEVEEILVKKLNAAAAPIRYTFTQHEDLEAGVLACNTQGHRVCAVTRLAKSSLLGFIAASSTQSRVTQRVLHIDSRAPLDAVSAFAQRHGSVAAMVWRPGSYGVVLDGQAEAVRPKTPYRIDIQVSSNAS